MRSRAACSTSRSTRRAPARSPSAPAAPRASPTGCSSACATTPRSTATGAIDAAAADAALDLLEVDHAGLDRLDREILSVDLRALRRRAGRALDARGRGGARRPTRSRTSTSPICSSAASSSARRAGAARPRTRSATSASSRRSRRGQPVLNLNDPLRAAVYADYPVWRICSSARTAATGRPPPSARPAFATSPRAARSAASASCSSSSTTTTRRPTPPSSCATSRAGSSAAAAARASSPGLSDEKVIGPPGARCARPGLRRRRRPRRHRARVGRPPARQAGDRATPRAICPRRPSRISSRRTTTTAASCWSSRRRSSRSGRQRLDVRIAAATSSSLAARPRAASPRSAVVDRLTKPTKLGLDLQGGVQLVYQGKPTAQQTTVTAESMQRALDIMRQRVDAFGVAEPELARVGKDQIEVNLPGVKNAERAAQQVGSTAQLFFYDWEANVLDENCKTDRHADQRREQPITGLYQAVKQASKCTGPKTATAPRVRRAALLRVRQGHQEAVQQRPAVRHAATRRCRTSTRGRSARTPRSSRCRPGVARRCAPRSRAPTPRRPTAGGSSATARALRGTDIKNPEQTFDQHAGNEPIVTFDFTDKGRKAFQAITRAIAQRGADNAPPAAEPEAALAALRDRARQRARLGAVHQLPREPGRHRRLDRRPDLRRLHDHERAGPGEDPQDRRAADQARADLALAGLGHARQAGARPGPHRRHRGLRRSSPSSCIIFYRVLGVIAAFALGDLRALLLRDRQADPDHADAAGHRRPDPHARRRGRREHRHLRTRQGGGARRQIGRRGDHRPATARA